MALIRTVTTRDNRTELHCTGCGEVWEPQVAIWLSSHEMGMPHPYTRGWHPLFHSGKATYADLDRMRRQARDWCAKHRQCAERPALEYVSERGVQVVDRRRR